MKCLLLGVAALAAVSVSLSAQEQGPPPVLDILRETIKEGKTAAHEKTEAAYVRAFRKAKYDGYYLALSSMSGPSEVWFLGGASSFAHVEKQRADSRVEPLQSDLDAAETADGALRESSRRMWTVYRKDLSYRPERMNLPKTRYVTVGIYRVRLGREEDFMAAAKSVLAGYEKANDDLPVLCYQVLSGAPNATFLFFTPMESLKGLDGRSERQAALRQAMGAENMQKLMRGTGEVFNYIENQLFAVSPSMSYVSPETISADPAFWSPKPAAKPKAAQ
jgi:hypothetical protein